MKILSVAGDRVAILLDGEATQNQYTVMEAELPPGSGPPPHVHSREDESFLVLSGEVTFYLGEKAIRLQENGYIFAPRNIPHHFRNTGSTKAILLETASPAGVERFFEIIGRPLPSRTSPPSPLTPQEIALMREKAPEFGIEILPS